MLATETQARKIARRYREDEPARTLREIVHRERIALKEIALHPAVDEDETVVCRWLNQSRDVPARKLPGLYYALKENMGIWSCLVEQNDLIVLPKPTVSVIHSPMQVLGQLSLSHARIWSIFSKILRKDKITADDVRKLREEVAR